MSIVVTLENQTPPERHDTLPWTLALIQEAATPDPAASWATIASVSLSPYDTDPSVPASHDFTTSGASLAQGWYRIVWQDAGGHQTGPTEPTQIASQLQGGSRPSVKDVAALLRARTVVHGGKETGTFTQATRPTDDEVENLIDMAMDEVMGKVKPIDYTQPFGSAYNAPGSDYERRIRRAVALQAAILVEVSYFPEQVRNDQSPVATYQQLFDSRIRALIAEGETGRAEGMGEGGAGGGSGDSPGDAYWSFPAAAPGGLVGYGSRW